MCHIEAVHDGSKLTLSNFHSSGNEPNDPQEVTSSSGNELTYPRGINQTDKGQRSGLKAGIQGFIAPCEDLFPPDSQNKIKNP